MLLNLVWQKNNNWEFVCCFKHIKKINTNYETTPLKFDTKCYHTYTQRKKDLKIYLFYFLSRDNLEKQKKFNPISVFYKLNSFFI